jgi:adenylate kinase family enzyme
MFRLANSLVYSFGSSSQKFIFLFGAPGVGKGTYAKLLRKDLGYNHVSTGDEIRKILKGTVSAGFDKALIETIKGIVKSGGLVKDEIVVQIINEKVKEPESAKGVILDGFPRTQGQLDKYLERFPIHGVLNITLRDDILLEKLMGRRTCLNCGTGFNICDIQRYTNAHSETATRWTLFSPRKKEFATHADTSWSSGRTTPRKSSGREWRSTRLRLALFCKSSSEWES